MNANTLTTVRAAITAAVLVLAWLSNRACHAGNLACDKAGTVVEHAKISQLSGGFAGPLDTDDVFGSTVTPLGDLDGDGFTDIAIGAQLDDDGGLDRGAVWILFLHADGSVKGQQKISSTSGGFGGTLDNNDQFGVRVASLDDLDGDGVTDLAVGAYLDDDGGTNRGAVWILFLNPNGTVKSSQKISGLAGGFGGVLDNQDQFGVGVGAIGDLDGDGLVELAVGAYNDDDGGIDYGAVWILFLNANGTVKTQQKISSTSGGFGEGLDNGDLFGVNICGLGDLDGDGVTELAVGAFLDDDGGSNRGAVWILFLNPAGTVKFKQKISDTAGGFDGTLDNEDRFGESVSRLGDLDDDGIGELVVGAYQDDDGGTDRGAVWVLFLTSNGVVKEARKISDIAGNFGGALDDVDQFGGSVSLLGDLDADGRPELAVGAAADDDGDANAGAIWLLSLDRCENRPMITDQPDSVLLEVGGGVAIFGISAQGTGELSYQWRRNATPLAEGGAFLGTNTSTLIVAATSTEIGLYDCVVSNAFGSATSAAAVLGLKVSCDGDLNGDGQVDGADLGVLLGAWGGCGL